MSQHTLAQLPEGQQANLFAISRLLLKVKISMSQQQLQTVFNIVHVFLLHQEPEDIVDLGNALAAWKLSEKLRQQVMQGKKESVLKLNMIEAASLSHIMSNTDFADYAIYEINVADYVLAEIDKQAL